LQDNRSVAEYGSLLPSRVGKELCKRGHNFTVLVSDKDTISRRVLQKRAFPGMNVITFRGPPGVGSDDWAASMSRDPQVVWPKSHTLPLLSSSYHAVKQFIASSLPLQSMAQLFADHKAMAEVLHKDNATIQQLKYAGTHLCAHICLTCG